MWEKLKTVFAIPELRQKILLTLGLLAVYRVGYQIRLPMVNPVSGGSGTISEILAKVSVFAATDLRQTTIFGLGIMPYISASIVFQLLGTVWPPIMALRKEGQAGQRRINELTRYLTVFLCLLQSFIFLKYYVMGDPNAIAKEFVDPATGTLSFGWQITAIMIMTCGTMFLMWLGEQIDEYGIGNGISLLIMAGIVAAMPQALMDLRGNMTAELSGSDGRIGPDKLLVLAALFVAVVFCVVFITMGQRRIQTQSAKHVRGRRVYGGTKQYLPLRINQAGVMPIIFASSLLMLPGMLFGVMAGWFSSDADGQSRVAKFLASLSDAFVNQTSLTHITIYVALIFFFCYFWTSITFNPKEMSENLKDHGTFIPGYRPGKRTADYLEKVMLRVTYVGAAFLAVVAIVPILVQSQLGVSFTVASFYGGTGLLIAVSVAFDLVQKIDNHLLMRNYKGLLEA